MFPMRSHLRRAAVLPIVLAFAAGLMLMQTPAACVPENLLSGSGGDESSSAQTTDALESGRTLTAEELQQLVANANDQDIVVVFTNPIEGPPGPTGPTGPTGPMGPAGPSGLVGEIRMWAGHPAHPPTGWLVCDGAEISRTEHGLLFDVIGTLYGSGDGTSTFLLPDFRNRSPIGSNTWDSAGLPLTTVSGTALFVGGSATHTLAESELPAHRHDMSHTHNVATSTDVMAGAATLLYVGTDNGGVIGNFASSSPSSLNTGPTGLNGAHNNLHPYFAVTYIICTGE